MHSFLYCAPGIKIMHAVCRVHPVICSDHRKLGVELVPESLLIGASQAPILGHQGPTTKARGPTSEKDVVYVIGPNLKKVVFLYNPLKK